MAGGGGRWGAFVRPWLWLGSKVYSDVLRHRRWNYNKGLYKSHAVDAPVICVGNMTTGGTGKTPMVAWVARQLQQIGRRPAIVTRGYKARGGKSDEAEMLDALCDCPIVVNANRVAGARTAIVAGADAVILDDGFQHRHLRRDLDIVLIDALNPFGYDHVLPRGLLREPLSALKDAHAVILTRSDLIAPKPLADLRQRLEQLAPQASLHLAVHRPIGGIDETGGEVELAALTGEPALAFCGLGNPEAFFATLRQIGAKVVSRIDFDDHVEYTPELAQKINAQADQHDAKILLTTQKDAVKLGGLQFDRPLRQLVVTIEIVDGEPALLERIGEVASPPEAAADDEA